MYELLKKRSNALISKEEFVRFYKEHFVITGNSSVNSIFRVLTTDPYSDNTESKEEDEEQVEEAESKDNRSSTPSKSPKKGRK
jgi:hypothetical protein